MRPWQLGNTTVRSPFRLRDGLIALYKSPIEGNLRGEQQEKAFRDLLGNAGIVTLGSDKTYSVGRKWRSALAKMGFLIPLVSEEDQSTIGKPDMITENGLRLIQSESVQAWQECFLRALAAYYIPSVLEPDYKKDYKVFSPLRHVLNVLLELEKRTDSSRLNFIEMALVVQFTSSSDDIKKVVDDVLRLRKRHESSPHKRRFNTTEYQNAATIHGYKTGHTFIDYADLNLRYLKATGLVLTKGKGITLAPEKHILVSELVKDIVIPTDPKEQILAMCRGAKLPTDKKDSAKLVLDDLVNRLESRGTTFDLSGFDLKDVKSISLARHEIEEELSKLNEVDFARQQAVEWEEIAAYMKLFEENKYTVVFKDEELVIPKSEAPAYFEWVMWRAFLAINKLVKPPYQIRRFKVDQDFLPVAPAPGGGADLICEFEDFVLGIEVTLTESSRQEAAEGESVRRHIAQIIEEQKATSESQKTVYGLFSARKIDTNTLETFRSGVWYGADRKKTNLDVVPLTINQFRRFFIGLFTNKKVDNAHVLKLLENCSQRQEFDAPQWEIAISERVDTYIHSLAN